MMSNTGADMNLNINQQESEDFVKKDGLSINFKDSLSF